MQNTFSGLAYLMRNSIHFDKNIIENSNQQIDQQYVGYQ